MIFDLKIIEIAAQVATIFALFLAIIGFFKERRIRKELQYRAKVLVWSDIAKIRGLMTDLEKPCDEGFDYGKHQAVGKLTSMYRDKIRQVYELSPNVTPNDIQLWRKSGKIASDWQEGCFWEVFPQGNLDSVATYNKFSAVDELPETHSMAAKPVEANRSSSEPL
ncbi:hypothetical protein [Hoeflea alexandrii]|uniref:hypothetical protein n=1 Tax=Hoeflea alexandrii TaxID=288436 RepID=UPI0022B04F7C|nr:hypothetical protein [Hoeflea alexandrii]MCZ4291942.1 hypothetical protein [Hoeflea alexandrii]